MRWPAVLLSTPFVLGLSSAQQTGSIAFVRGSRINLRAQPSSAAAVVGHLVVNTEVRLRERNREWCEVEVQPGGERGFLACGLLAESKLSLEDIEARLRESLSREDALDWRARAFWVAPSLTRWIAVGYAVQEVHLPLVEAREMEDRKPHRFPVPEFEAMKDILERGITVAPPISRPPKWQSEIYTSGNVASAMQRISFPAVTESYFRAEDVPFAIPTAPFSLHSAKYAGAELADTLSAAHAATMRVRVAGPASFVHIGGGADYDTIAGLWDVGAIEVTYQGAVTIHAVTSRGESADVQMRAMLYDFGPERCTREPLRLETESVSGAAPWSSAIVSWVGKPPVAGRVAVTVRQLDGSTEYDKLVVHDVDLDGDGIFDLSSWAGRYQPQVGAEGYWNAVFGNVGGRWKQLAYDEDDDCT